MTYLIIFMSWTFVIYWMHRLVHNISFLQRIHADHHRYVNEHEIGWHWSNVFLYNDTWMSTLDLWITEVIPTLIMSFFFGYWLFVIYYFWAAFVQETIEHNNRFDLYPWITSGKWHMIHHKNNSCNYGIFFPIWDILFNTRKKHI